jgi:hypothetical protein
MLRAIHVGQLGFGGPKINTLGSHSQEQVFEYSGNDTRATRQMPRGCPVSVHLAMAQSGKSLRGQLVLQVFQDLRFELRFIFVLLNRLDWLVFLDDYLFDVFA